MGEILFALVFLMACWHGLKHGVPRGFRAAAAHRRSSIDKWRSAHPDSPAASRYAAGAARTATAAIWGLPFLWRAFKAEFRTAWADGKRKYRVGKPEPAPQPEPQAEPSITGAGASGDAPAPEPEPAEQQRPKLHSVPNPDDQPNGGP